MSEELVVKEQQAVQNYSAPARGFEDENDGDVLIPRLKLIQDLSPERKEKIADAGDILNSLSKEKLEGRKFIPVFKYTNNIKWKPRSEGGGMVCRSEDGKVAMDMANNTTKQCASCGQCEFDNTKEGKDAQPLCTKYINFLGFIEGERFPIVLSFCRTYLNEGKKMYSLAKFTMKDMWHNAYTIKTKLMSKNDNDWYVITAAPGGVASKEDKEFGEMLYTMFRGKDFKADLEDDADFSGGSSTIEVDSDIANEI